MTDIRPIKTEADYDWALREIAPYFGDERAAGTPEAARFDVLASPIESYEAHRWPIEAPDPVDAILGAMEMRRMKQAALGRLLGSRSRATEVPARKRPITRAQAYTLHVHGHIPAEILIRPYRIGTTG